MSAKLRVLATGSSGNCYVLEAGRELYILDCGIRYKDILKGIDYRLSDVKGVFITHEHSDHMKACKDFIEMGVSVYSNSGVNGKFPEAKKLVTGRIKTVGSIKVVAFPLPHDDTPNVGFMFYLPDGEKLIYATDYSYFPYTFRRYKVAHWLIECNHLDQYLDSDEGRFKHSVRGHAGLNTVIKMLKANATEKLRQVMICHMSSDFGDDDLMKAKIESELGCPVHIARKNAEMEV